MNPTTSTQNDKTSHLTLKGRIDDLRVRAHLAGMEIHDKLEALAHEADALGRKTTRMTKEIARKLHAKIDALEALIVRD